MPKRKQIGHKASVGRPNSFIKKSIITLLGIGILLYPLICFPSYIIHLKDGREVATDQYWEEADQIKFKQYGGVIGIQKDLINEIEDVGDLPEKKKRVVVRKAIETAEKVETEKEKAAEPVKKVGAGEQTAPSSPEDVAKKKAFLEEKRGIIDEINNASSAFKEAKAKKDRVKKDEYWEKRLLLREDLTKLRKHVMSEYGGTLPPWWDSVK
jgi:hypothetical protein